LQSIRSAHETRAQPIADDLFSRDLNAAGRRSTDAAEVGKALEPLASGSGDILVLLTLQ